MSAERPAGFALPVVLLLLLALTAEQRSRTEGRG
jgi:uncharacterized protein (TIGR03382 family)